MKYSIVYSSNTGNTKLLAETLRSTLPAEDCVYFGVPDKAALEAERVYIGFWTDKGNCDELTADFIKSLGSHEVFLFGTAGFGIDDSYFKRIIDNVRKLLPESSRFKGSFMCQGKMPMSVRERYVKMSEDPAAAPRMKNMIANFDSALSHPDSADLEALKKAAAEL